MARKFLHVLTTTTPWRGTIGRMIGRKTFAISVEGGINMMTAIALPILLIAMGASVDFVRYIDRQAAAQAHVDAAALAAARVFIDHAAQTQAEQMALATRRVREVLTEAGEDFGENLKVTVDAVNMSVGVQATEHLPTSFLSIVDIRGIDAAVSALAAAEIESQPVCILALKSDDGTGIKFSGEGEMKARDCVVWSDATGAQSIAFDGSGKVSASRLCAVGRASSVSRFAVKPEPESDCTHVGDPLVDWTPPSVGNCTYQFEGWISRTTAQLDPGVYCGGLRVDAKNIFLSPGIYVIQNGPLVLRGESKISGKGVGIILAGENAALDIDGKSRVELTADTSGPMAGIVIASFPSGGNEVSSITGRSDLKIGGVIYLPRHDLTYRGESDTRAASPVTTIIGHTIDIGGDAFLEVKNDKAKAKYAPIVSTGNGSVRLLK